MLDESREACGAQVGVTGSSPLQTYFRERERETKVPSPVSTPHPSIISLGFFAIQPSALLRLFHVHRVYGARVYGRERGSCFLFVVNSMYNDACKTLFKRFFFPLSISISVASFHFFLASLVLLQHTPTNCMPASEGCCNSWVCRCWIFGSLPIRQQGKNEPKYDDIPVLIDISYVENRRTNNILHIMGHIGQITGHLKFVMVTTVSVMERRNSLTLQYISLN